MGSYHSRPVLITAFGGPSRIRGKLPHVLFVRFNGRSCRPDRAHHSTQIKIPLALALFQGPLPAFQSDEGADGGYSPSTAAHTSSFMHSYRWRTATETSFSSSCSSTDA